MAPKVIYGKRDVLSSQKAVARALDALAGVKVRVVPTQGIDNAWWNARVGERVRFQLHPLDGGPLFGTLRRGGRLPVFALADADATPKRLVFAYTERWTCERQGQFLPYDASVVACAFAPNATLEEIVRADWDARLANTSKGQPHWHALADDFESVDEEAGEAPPPSLENGELQYLLGGVHLPMAGWRYDHKPPAVWRCEFSIDTLPAWAEAVVQHLAEELANSRYLRWETRR